MRTDKLKTQQKCLAVSALLVCIVALNSTQVFAEKSSTHRRKIATTPGSPSLQTQLKQCGKNSLCLRLLAEYGGMFAANTHKVLLPPKNFLRGEGEIQLFQRRAGISSEMVGRVRVELQAQALKAFLAARKEARNRGLEITPRGTNSSRRSYADTVVLWRNRVNPALSYWVSRGRLTKIEAETLRSLSIDEQVTRVLALETKHIYFGTGFGKSILQSVAAPGASQHNFMLALDVDQYGNPQVRAILAKHGWFQTVRNDAPHFTYLGVNESALPSLGLTRDSSNGIPVWIPIIAIRRTSAVTEDKKEGPRKAKSKTTTMGKESEVPDDLEKDQRNSVRPPVARAVPLNGTIGAGVTIQTKMEPLLHSLTENYFEVSGGMLHITSGYRSPAAQARAMYHNILAYGRAHVLETYGGRAAAVEIIGAYRKNPGKESEAIEAMTKVILEQVSRGIYISRHMLGRAFDIRLGTANAPILREVVRNLGGRLAVEADHYHAEFQMPAPILPAFRKHIN
jgi:hypothetical protein